ncbi:MAG: ATP-dependent RecD-like DNA helicase [Anaerolineae bacterium]|nr:ATP-dependent RecD-like DNA helicase [Anaerolineae bacterium]
MLPETLEGTIERITYFSEESGYTVLRLKPHVSTSGGSGKRGPDLHTVVGVMPPLQPGESVRFTGVWVMHAEYGRQFKAESVMQIVPATVEGLRRYLGGGMIKGVGPTTAQRIIDHFGLDVIDILNNAPERVREVPGIGAYRAELIARSWADQFRVREIMIFLKGHGITDAQAVKIYKEYGEAAISIVKGDPYRLARDITGIGFRIADRIAQSLGLAPDAPERIRAGVLFALETFTNDGHIYAPRPLAAQRVAELLMLQATEDEYTYDDEGRPIPPPNPLIEDAIDQLAADAEIVKQHVPDDDGQMVEALYLRYNAGYERQSARRLLEMTGTGVSRLRSARTMSWLKFFQIIAREGHTQLSEQQKEAVEAALTHKVSVLTGGPGTGKTTTLRAVIRALEWNKARYELASPTGRAAKRLSEATGRPARTIHRLLGFVPGEGFGLNADDPLDVDMLIIDEASMIDQALFYNVLKALPAETHLMLVGDVDQLPSVGAGDVLRDLIRSGVPHVTRLDTIFRQASGSQIIANAHRINRGEMPILDNQSDDFFWFGGDDPFVVADLVVDIVKNRIPNRFDLDPLNDVQVLAPMYKGPIGIQALNEKLQAALNPPGRQAEKRIGGIVFRVGDKVMQTRNNYEKDVYNGDIGRISAIDFTDQKLRVNMNDRLVDYDFTEVEDLVQAFAVSVHKSQGSEYPAVVLPVMPQHYMMLQRNLLYTAVTRAKRLVVMAGQRRAVGIAVNNDKVTRRFTALAWRLAQGRGGS